MKKIFLFLAACAVAGAANAQVSNFNSNSKFGDNWSIGVEAGVQTNLSQFHSPQGAVFGINLNKDLTPYFGLSLQALAGANNTGNWYVPMGHYHNGTAIDNLTGFLTGRWNITNSFCGFNGGRRTFELETNVGVGYGKFFVNHNYAYNNGVPTLPFDQHAFQFKSGLNFNFYLGQAKAWAISIRPAVVWNLSATGQFYNHHAVGQLTAACTYNFKTSNGTHSFIKSDVSILQDEIAALTALNADLQAQLANRPAAAPGEVIVEKVVEQVSVPTYVDNTFVINFALNSAELTPEAKATLNGVPTSATANVAGYASPEGSKEYNLQLSDRRAEAVKAYLESRGVKVNKTIGYGADNAESNRIVIVTLQ